MSRPQFPRRRLAASVGLLLLACLCAGAAEGGPSTETLSVDDVMSTQTIHELQVSADGNWLAWSQDRPDPDGNRRVRDLWRVDLKSKERIPRQLTRGGNRDRNLRWSPTGASLGFLSERGPEKDGQKPKTQIWRIAPDGGEAERVSDWKAGVDDFRWSSDSVIIFLAGEDKTRRERELEKKKDDARVVEDEEFFPPKRLFALDLETKEIARLTTNDDQIDRFWIRGDGRALVTRHITTPHSEWQPGGPYPLYFLHDLDAGDSREILSDPQFDPERVEFTGDGTGLLAEWIYSRKSTEELRVRAGIRTLWSVDLENGARHQIELGSDKGLAAHVRGDSWQVTEKGFMALLADEVHVQPAFYAGAGEQWETRLLTSERGSNWLAAAIDRERTRMAYLYSESDQPEEIYYGKVRSVRFNKDRSPTRDAQLDEDKLIHTPQPELKAKLSRSEAIAWNAKADGMRITGILTYPRDYTQGRRYPLMLWLHGGPTGVDADNLENYWASFPHLLASKGMFVLQPNYRGGVDHGLDHVEALVGGGYCDVEIPDLIDGTDLLIEQGLVHPDSLGTMGWSNGAILSIQLTVKSDRFKVCCAGAGDVNWLSDFGNCAFGGNFDMAYLGAAPWDDPQLYMERSPLFQMDRVRTPTLIQFGEKDTSVPTEQGWQHYRALQLHDKAPVRFLLYPGMGHGLTKLSYQRRKIEEELAWIDRHLFGRESTLDELIEPGSPLDHLLARSRERESRPLETMIGGVPVAALASEAIGEGVVALLARTEVTRGQYAAYLQTQPDAAGEAPVGWNASVGAFPAGSESLPVSGLSVEAARGYVEWLNSVSGSGYRLPTPQELELASRVLDSAAGDNNLCRWAGYAPTPDETRTLRERIGTNATPEELLLPVGTTGGKSGAEIFDLEGGVSEWAWDPKRNQARLVGRCALDGCDPAQAPAEAPLALRGFRLASGDFEAPEEEGKKKRIPMRLRDPRVRDQIERNQQKRQQIQSEDEDEGRDR